MDKPNYKSIGYARVSTSGQTTEGQVVDLKKEGCCVVFQETISTTVKEKERPQLMAALSALDEGDELVVTKMDRLGWSQVEVVNRIHDLQQQGIHIRTLDGLINTRGLGKFAPVLIGLLSGLAEVERSLARRGLSLSAIAPLSVLNNNELEQQLANLDSNADECIDACFSIEEQTDNDALDYLKKLKKDSRFDENLNDDIDVETSRSLIPLLGEPLSTPAQSQSRNQSRNYPRLGRSRVAASRWHRFNLAPGVELHVNDSVTIPPAGTRRLNWLQRLADRLIEQLDEGNS